MAQPQSNIHELSKQVTYLRQNMAQMKQNLREPISDKEVDFRLKRMREERQLDIRKREKSWLAQSKSYRPSDVVCSSCRTETPHYKLIVKKYGEDELICPYLLIIGLMRLNNHLEKQIEFDPDKIIKMAQNGKKKKETI